MIGTVGVYCAPDGPCMLPVWIDLYAPSGVYMIGIALVLRDMVQLRYGHSVALLAIVCGCVLSFFVADPRIAVASLIAFGVSETVDWLVFTMLKSRSVLVAIVVSGIVGLFADSVVFLYFAFGSIDHIAGQIVGKLWMVIIGAVFVSAIHRNRRVA